MPAWIHRSLLAAIAAGVLHAETKLEDIPTYKLGLDALSGRLWEVAASRFEAALETEELPPEFRAPILLRLAEARIRGNQAELALKTLEDEALAEHPDRAFWQAQALAGSGRFLEAIEALRAIENSEKFRTEIALTQALLERAVGDPRAALATLDSILAKPKPPATASLLKAEILLAEGRAEAALKALPSINKLGAADSRAAELLKARALLAEDKADQAIPVFAKLTESPENQTLTNHHRAFIGLAEARLKQGSSEAAADGLLAFIQQNPSSPLLDEAFDVLLACLPEQAAPNDPILSRLREWAPPAPVQGPYFSSLLGGAAHGWPLAAPITTPLAPHVLFYLAQGTRKETSPSATRIAQQLLTRLRLEFPNHPLVPRSLLEAGRWHLEAGERAKATACFESLNRMGQSSPPELRAQALTLEAGALFSEKKFDEAAALFDEAADLLEDDHRRSAQLNAATSLLAAGDVAAFDRLDEEAEDPDLQVQLALERALYLTSARSPEALPALLSFIQKHPDHARIPEARLSAALAALDASPAKPEEAETQLEQLTAEDLTNLPAGPLALARIRLLERKGEWTEAASLAAEYLKTTAPGSLRDVIRYERGKALFQNKDYNDARLTLQTLAEESPDCPQAPAALLLSARAAAEGGTPQSQAESLALFDQLMDSDSEFHEVARLEKADLLIRLSRLKEAVETLDSWFDEMKDEDPLVLSIGLLLGDALFAHAEGDPEILKRALVVYDRLLSILPDDSPMRARVLYQKGLSLEQFEGRESEALQTYIDVVDAAVGTERNDWKSVELCGFSALRILEKREQWAAATKLARRIAELKGPRSEEAADRAKTLGLEHYIWED